MAYLSIGGNPFPHSNPRCRAAPPLANHNACSTDSSLVPATPTAPWLGQWLPRPAAPRRSRTGPASPPLSFSRAHLDPARYSVQSRFPLVATQPSTTPGPVVAPFPRPPPHANRPPHGTDAAH